MGAGAPICLQPAKSLPPLAPQQSEPWPPNILNLPTPMFLLYINIEKGKNMLNVRLDGDHQYGKLLFTCLSLVMSLMVSFCAVFLPRDVLDEIWTELSQFLRVFLPTLSTSGSENFSQPSLESCCMF